MNNLDRDDFAFVPLGGSGEIGMNANLYHLDGRWLMIDLGISFPDDTMPGIDVVLPDLSFIERHKESLEAIILSHAHEDHFGALPYLWSRLGVPVYGTAFTLALLRRKLAESRQTLDMPLRELTFNKDYEFGPFSIELVKLTHSIPDPAAIIMRTRHGTIVHTGDWKFDETPMLGEDTDKARLREIGEEGVLALVGDSTNALVEGRTPSEATARQGLTDTIAKAKNRVAVTCFASNVARIDSIIAAASANNRSVCIVGRALNRVIGAAKETGYLKNIPDFVPEGKARRMSKEKIVFICTGSQGEPRAAMAKIAASEHESVHLEAGDMVIYSSRQIPGNEPAITRIQDKLLRRKIHVITDEDEAVHVSGHPAREELIEMYGLIKPKIAIPVHGTARHLLAHAELATSCQTAQTLIPNNGSVIRFAQDKAHIHHGQVQTGLLTHEGGEIVALEADFLRSRKHMLWNGTVTLSVVLSASGDLLLAPMISQTGLCAPDHGDEFLAEAAIAVEEALDNLSDEAIFDNKLADKVATKAVSAIARARFRRRPTIHTHILYTSDEGVA